MHSLNMADVPGPFMNLNDSIGRKSEIRPPITCKLYSKKVAEKTNSTTAENCRGIPKNHCVSHTIQAAQQAIKTFLKTMKRRIFLNASVKINY
ncbi:hypothetical protein BH11BAC1_BH11BAC1_10020 [soil metagenome]